MSRLAGLWRTHHATVLIIGGVAAVLLIVALFWPITDLMAAHDVGRVAASQRAAHLQTAREAVRAQFLTLAAGVFVAGALWFTAQNFRLSRQGQVTDRYTKAIEQLGSDKLDVRIGGIYALERVARDSSRDHPTAMEVLAAFIREHSRERWPPAEPGAETPQRATRPDVQAAVTVIGRRNREHHRGPINLAGAELPFADLTSANLTRAILGGANLIGANLTYANLTDAYLGGANLTGAILGGNLTGTNLLCANLTDANLGTVRFADAFLNGANFTGANLSYTDFAGANLVGWNLDHVDLMNAHLRAAHLTRADLWAVNLTGANLTGARYPEEWPVPEGWLRDPGSGRLRRPDPAIQEDAP